MSLHVYTHGKNDLKMIAGFKLINLRNVTVLVSHFRLTPYISLFAISCTEWPVQCFPVKKKSSYVTTALVFSSVYHASTTMIMT